MKLNPGARVNVDIVESAAVFLPRRARGRLRHRASSAGGQRDHSSQRRRPSKWEMNDKPAVQRGARQVDGTSPVPDDRRSCSVFRGAADALRLSHDSDQRSAFFPEAV